MLRLERNSNNTEEGNTLTDEVEINLNMFGVLVLDGVGG
jgi:hypothetical protein